MRRMNRQYNLILIFLLLPAQAKKFSGVPEAINFHMIGAGLYQHFTVAVQ